MPAEAGFSFTTSTGQKVTARRLNEGDIDLLIDLFDHLSAESRYHRFHRSLAHPSLEQVRQGAEQLLHVDGVAWIAFSEVDGAAAPVAVARYVCLTQDQAEPALTVRDDFQGQGIGRVLFARLIAAAQKENIHQFVATVQSSNQAAVQLVKNAGLPTTQTVSDGQIVLTIALSEEDVGARPHNGHSASAIRHLPPVTA
jgi:GNAT superfamily N-acetyltransferase